MTTFYLATPYTGHRDGQRLAYQDALWASVLLIDHGIDVFSPVVHFHPISKRMKPRPHSFWMERCMSFLLAADELLVVKMPGWDASGGIAEEVRTFEDIRRPPLYLEWPMTDLDVAKVLERAIA